MSEIEYEATVYHDEQQALKKIAVVCEAIQTGEHSTAMSMLKAHGLKRSFSFGDLLNIKAYDSHNRLRVLFDTSIHGEAGPEFTRVLGKMCSAVLVREYNNQVAEEAFYGYVNGRKRKLPGMIKALKTFDPDIALYEAANRGRVNDVRTLLSKGADPNVSYDAPLLILCVLKERVKIFEMLLKAGANPDQTRNDGDALLITAAEQFDSAYVTLALNHGADPNKFNHKGVTPLMKACKYGRLKSIEALIEAAAAIEAKDNDGKTALMYACGWAYAKEHIALASIQTLMEAGVDIHAADDAGKTPMAHAITSKREKLLLNAGASYYIPESEYTGAPEADLFIAIRYNHAKKVNELLKQDLDLNTITNDSGYPPLMAAMDRPEILSQLIDHGGDAGGVHDEGDTLLHRASLHGYAGAAQVLIDHGLSLQAKNARGRTPLHKAATFGSHDIVDLLLKNGADPTVIDEDGDTPLDEALGLLNDYTSETVDVFVNHGVLDTLDDLSGIIEGCIERNLNKVLDILLENAKDIQDMNYLWMAVWHKNIAAFKQILRYGVNVDFRKKDYWNMPVFNLVCRSLVTSMRHEKEILSEMFTLLVDKGVDIDAPNESGITPIFYFQTQKGFESQTSLLIKLGAEINTKAEEMGEWLNTYCEEGTGVTPLMAAVKKGLFNNAEILIDAGADLSLENEEGLTAIGFARKYRKKKLVKLMSELS